MKTIKHVLSRMAIGLVFFGIGLGIITVFAFFTEISLVIAAVFCALVLAYCLGSDVLDK